MQNTSLKKEKGEKNKKTLVLLDAHAILHRAYHALPPLTSPDGKPTGALYGLASMLLKIIRELKPDYIAACYDMKAPTFRHIAYKQYKGTRAKTDDELIAQFDISRDVVRVFGIPVYEKETFEADDIIGSVTEQVKKEKNLAIIIASGDLDALQLVEGDHVRVYTLRKGIQDTLLYDEEGVRGRFGFAPELLVDFKGLKGDPSDNIPGVKGIGEKTAIELIQKFGTLERIMEAAKKHPDKMKKEGVKERIIGLLKEQEEQAFFSKELASIRKDAPISFSLKDAEWSAHYSFKKMEQLFRALGFLSLLSRLPIMSAAEPADHEDEQKKGPRVIVIRGGKEWGALIKEQEIYWALSEEHVFFVTKKGDVYALPKSEITRHIPSIKKLAPCANRAFGAKPILHFLDAYGASIDFKDDLQILFWLLNPERTTPSFEEAFHVLFPTQDFSSSLSYAFLPRMYDALTGDVEIKGVRKVYEEIEMPLLPVLFGMEKAGIACDRSSFVVLEKNIKKEMDALEKQIYESAGERFTINSPKDFSRILFEKLSLSPKGIRKTAGGKRSTKHSELIKLRHLHPVVNQVLRYREIGKLYSTYVIVLPALTGDDGRIHTTFHQTGTATGRLSSSDPNLQNIPVRSELGDAVRRAFVARKGHIFLACDYSQIQLRIAAMLSRDGKMLGIFERGEDIHSATAAEVFNVGENKVTPEMRRRAKIINFGILYGMGASALSENLGVPKNEAYAFLHKYFTTFPELFSYFEKIKEEARSKGYVETLFGRKRFLPNIVSYLPHIAHEAERMAINAPIQGGEADLIKKAMIDTHRAIKKDPRLRGNVSMLLQIHDELLFEVKKDALDEAAGIIPPILEAVYPNDYVSFLVERKTGPNWADLKKV